MTLKHNHTGAIECPACNYNEESIIVKKLDEEIKATEDLIREGDPFLISRKEYLQNLKTIKGG